ncbi:hypothetical protein OG455_00210 [Kitasatospora sp. NBC_01287]|uniref:hypothetical protein n=1 Tax=Kitasatospora sp. NBC_01287 TaxID=2903573 RepID=UPI002259A35A|nr:hypothetical protein [Kitasatospora sp. NBC_01287]MCX4743949.1 hypothetical protein [Kitasatospora sp. NBC_01287]
MTRTTPPRPLDITAEFPELAGLARTATRLHPTPGAPTVHDSSVGGPLLWPTDEPWPYDEPGYPPYKPLPTLADVHQVRALLTQAWARPRGPRESLLTVQEKEAVERLCAGHDPELLPSGPQPLIPLVQLYARDVPALAFPHGTDLLQIVWAPRYGIEGCSTNVQLRWRLASQVRQVLRTPPEPAYVECDDHVPQPCLLHPEPVRELPPGHLLDQDLEERVYDWCAQHSVSYQRDLSVAPGWKAGGWPAPFTFRDPPESESDDERHCGECGAPLEALLTIDSSEWDGANGSWRPTEEGPGAAELVGHPYQSLREPTMMTIGRGYTLQIYNCTATPSHLPRTIMQ